MKRPINRRIFMAGAAGALGLVFLAEKGWADMNLNFLKKKDKHFAYTLSDAQWREKLPPEAYRVLREAGTEAPRSSPLNAEKRAGVFHCKGCDWPLFDSRAKFESGTGWPSFYQPINDQAVGESTDFKLVVPRTEIHCAHCGGHLGHVFDDGPAPTGLRYCMNGVAMTFTPTGQDGS